jgi:hypothetical protein
MSCILYCHVRILKLQKNLPTVGGVPRPASLAVNFYQWTADITFNFCRIQYDNVNAVVIIDAIFVLRFTDPSMQCCRKYETACKECRAAREVFAQQFRRDVGRRQNVQYPENLKKLPALADWLRHEVSMDVKESSKLHEVDATTYRHMYAHGLHLRIKDSEEEKMTCDSVVAAAVWKKRTGREFQDVGEIETKEFVGWIQEILELDYRSHCCIVLVCS